MVLLVSQNKETVINFANYYGIEVKSKGKKHVLQVHDGGLCEARVMAEYDSKEDAKKVLEVAVMGIENSGEKAVTTIPFPTPEELPQVFAVYDQLKQITDAAAGDVMQQLAEAMQAMRG